MCTTIGGEGSSGYFQEKNKKGDSEDKILCYYGNIEKQKERTANFFSTRISKRHFDTIRVSFLVAIYREKGYYENRF